MKDWGFLTITAYIAAIFVLLVAITADIGAVPLPLLISSALITGCAYATIVMVSRRLGSGSH